MILPGIRTQAHIIDVCLHLSPTGNQFLYKGSASQDIPLSTTRRMESTFFVRQK